jgi:hypothetical protein
MGCALSGDWQGGKLKAALPYRWRASRPRSPRRCVSRMGTLVASSVPDRVRQAGADRSMDWTFALVASAR